LRTDADEDGSWEARLARRYYERLFREYVISDLAGYRTGCVGFRWRTEAEVVQGKGQFYCGHRPCSSKLGLRSYEVDFKYREASESKRALVKARLCERCAYKLHYKRLKAERKRSRAASKETVEEEMRDETGKEDQEPSPCDDVDAEDAGGEDGKLTDAERRRMEALAWQGPDPQARTREDDFDDYFNGLFL